MPTKSCSSYLHHLNATYLHNFATILSMVEWHSIRDHTINNKGYESKSDSYSYYYLICFSWEREGSLEK